MKLPNLQNRVGLTTAGLTGNVVLAGVIFGGLNPWWLIVSIIMILSGIGSESGKNQ
jgi:uncharacterized membrane protein YoaK (UPF0700 family)